VSDAPKTLQAMILSNYRPMHLSVFSEKTGVLQWKTSLLQHHSLIGNTCLTSMPDEDVTLGNQDKTIEKELRCIKKLL
jgi:hypothetical protein